MLVRSSLVVAIASVLAGAAGCSSSDTSGPGGAGGGSGGSGGGSTSSGGVSGGSSGAGSGSSSSGGGSGGGSGSSSSGGSSSSSGGGTQIAWHTGMTIGSSVTIPAGETVTIDPGAIITMGSGVTVTVDGTLTASAATTHAKLASASGSWVGLVVSGTLSLDGVDISGASAALDIKSGGKGEYDDGTIDASNAPFNVEASGSLGMKHSTLSQAAGTCNIAGSFTASYLTYTGGGSGFFDGFVTNGASAELSIEDSTFTGPGPNGPLHDMLVSGSGASKFHVAYTNISSMHCGFHFGAMSEFDISYVNDDSNAFGFMLYGSSGAGPFTVSYSNVDDSGPNGMNAYDAEGTNGPITFDHDYVNGIATDPNKSVSVTNASSGKVSGTGPR
jgi:hypothetical protein